MIRDCKDCGADYRVPVAEQDWCAAQGISLPRRCPTCRAERRGINDERCSCAICGVTFDYPREFALLVATLSLPAPQRCPAGCAQDDEEFVEPALSPTDRSLADLWGQVYDQLAPVEQPIIRRLPREPEELFKPDMGRSKVDDAAGPEFDDVPSPDALFQGLGGPSGSSKS